MPEKKIIVIGAGLAGVTSAYALQKRGYAVTLIDALRGPAQGTSFANAGMLHPSMPAPWNEPGVGRDLIASLFNPRAAMKLRLKALPGLTKWGLKFLKYSEPEHHWYAAKANFRLAEFSVRCMQALQSSLALDFDAVEKGTLKIFEDRETMAASLTLAKKLADLGLIVEELDGGEAVTLEPALKAIEGRIAGAIYHPNDTSGDAQKFTEAMVRHFIDIGGETRFNANVTGLMNSAKHCSGVILGETELFADHVILAAGNHSPLLARTAQINLPIKPVKGYSLTAKSRDISMLPQTPVIDEGMHAAVTPLGDRIRVSGTAELAGFDSKLNKARIDNLKDMLTKIYPALIPSLNMEDAQAWAGFRPVSADGLPFIGTSKLQGLWMNTGHGHLGWTLAAGSGELLADLMQGKTPKVDPNPYRATR